jgi:hypothetical protein
MSPRQPTGIRWRRVLIGPLVLAVCVGGAICWITCQANPPFPDPPELADVSLELPKTPPVSRPLARLLSGGIPDGYSRGEATDLVEQVLGPTGAWPQRPEAALRVLERLEPSLAQVAKALEAPGCLPRPSGDFGQDDKVSYLLLLRASGLLVVREVIRARRQPAEAAEALLRLGDRLLALEQRCAPDLVAAMVLSPALDVVHRGWGYLLALPELAPELQQQLWQRAVALEQRPSPLADAMRQEAAFLISYLEKDLAEDVREEGGHRAMWPWYDREQTIKTYTCFAKRRVWLAMAPLDSEAWIKKELPEEAYLERVREQPGFYNLFRYNSVGTILLAIGGPDFRRYILKWHQQRCLLAARRARWDLDLQRQDRQPPKAIPSKDPFNASPFSVEELHAKACAVPPRFGQEMAGVPVSGLPRDPAR